MVSSTGSGRVVGECARRAGEAVVEGDRGREGEEACPDAGAEAVQGAGAVAFEREQVFAGLEDRLDSLSDWREPGPVAGFVFPSWPDDCRVELGGCFLELASGVAFVAERVHVSGSLAALEQGEADLAFGRLGRAELQRPRCAVEREQAVQAEAPEVGLTAST